jgi:hypothetical protein
MRATTRWFGKEPDANKRNFQSKFHPAGGSKEAAKSALETIRSTSLIDYGVTFAVPLRAAGSAWPGAAGDKWILASPRVKRFSPIAATLRLCVKSGLALF